jgi:hypothetical protein
MLSFVNVRLTDAQTFQLFSPEVKRDYPSVVYDFLERYLYEIDSLQSRSVPVDLRLRDDKVNFLIGSAGVARQLTPETAFELSRVDERYYKVTWRDTLDNNLLELSFPMQYELLLGKSKTEIEQEFRATLSQYNDFVPNSALTDVGERQDDGCLTNHPVSNYYVTSVNTATYYSSVDKSPTFSAQDKWHSVANLFQGCIADIGRYTLYINQSLYGFKSVQYTLPLSQWLAYCQAMQLKVYFAVEEEREDGLKALLIAQSQDLGFNHMISLIIPDDFVEARSCVIKGTLNAYIPTQNVKELYQQYVDKPKKRVL